MLHIHRSQVTGRPEVCCLVSFSREVKRVHDKCSSPPDDVVGAHCPDPTDVVGAVFRRLSLSFSLCVLSLCPSPSVRLCVVSLSEVWSRQSHCDRLWKVDGPASVVMEMSSVLVFYPLQEAGVPREDLVHQSLLFRTTDTKSTECRVVPGERTEVFGGRLSSLTGSLQLTACWICSLVDVPRLTANSATQTARGFVCGPCAWPRVLSTCSPTRRPRLTPPLTCLLSLQPSRPGYPSPHSSEGFYPSPQHPGHYQVCKSPPTHSPTDASHGLPLFPCQMAAYPGPHTLPSVPSALYPPQAALLDTHHAHTHPRHHVHTHSHVQHLPQPHGQDMALWGSAMEVGGRRSSLSFRCTYPHWNCCVSVQKLTAFSSQTPNMFEKRRTERNRTEKLNKRVFW